MPLPRDFYLRDPLAVGRDLLGKELVRVTPEGTTSGIIVETEAYKGALDAASHAFGGVRTARTAVMYDEGGRAYVYLIYGLHHCLNITCGPAGVADCVLIRALEPRQGIDLMLRRRNLTVTDVRLTNGPGKLCQALAIDLVLYGADLCGDQLFISDAPALPAGSIGTSRRINVDYAGAARDLHWRFFVKDNRYVSRLPDKLKND